MFAKVKDAPGFVRGQNRAILAVDNQSLEAYKTKKKKDKELSSVISEINTIKNEVNDIKSILNQILVSINKSTNA
jgi:hypothetical protein